MPHRSPESRRCLAAEEPSRAIGDRARDHHRDGKAASIENIRYGGDRRFGVERVEDGLDEEQVGTAFDQTLHLLGIGAAQVIEGDGAKAGIGYVGRDRGGAVCRPDGTRDKARMPILRLRQIGRRSRKLCTLAV